MMRSSVRAALALVLLVGACKLGVRLPQPNECRSDFDCGLEEICTLGVCVQVASPERQFDMSFTPPNDSGYLKQQVSAVRVSTSGTVPDHALKPSVLLVGRVLIEGSADPSGIRARVEASRAGEIQGTTVRASAVTVADAMTGTRTYRLSVVPGVYTITIFPEELGLPPVRSVEMLDLTNSLQTDLILPPKESFPRLTGKVVHSEIDRSPIVGAKVQAFEVDGPGVSTIGLTDAYGRYEIVLPPRDAAYRLRVSPSSQNANVPTVEISGVAVTGSAELDPIAVGRFDPPMLFQARVFGLLEDGRQTPVGRANVQLTGLVGNGTWTVQTATNEDGSLEIELPLGMYTVEVRPPIESVFALHTGAFRALAGQEAARWVVGRKARLSGQVTNAKGEPVVGVSVQANRTGALVAGADSVHYLKGVSTDSDGRYSLLLDRGIYDLSFTTEGQPLARGDLANFSVAADELRHDQRLTAGVAVSGIVRTQSGEPFADVTVEIHGGAANSCTLLGTGVTDASGRYRIVIPDAK